jgi:hypothetical protein
MTFDQDLSQHPQQVAVDGVVVVVAAAAAVVVFGPSDPWLMMGKYLSCPYYSLITMLDKDER